MVIATIKGSSVPHPRSRKGSPPLPSVGTYVNAPGADIPGVVEKISVKVGEAEKSGNTFVDLSFQLMDHTIVLTDLALQRAMVSKSVQDDLTKYIKNSCYSLGSKRDIYKYQSVGGIGINDFKPSFTQICVYPESLEGGIFTRAELLLGREGYHEKRQVHRRVEMVFDMSSRGDHVELENRGVMHSRPWKRSGSNSLSTEGTELDGASKRIKVEEASGSTRPEAPL